MAQQIGVAGCHRNGFADFGLCQNIAGSGGAADRCTTSAPLVADRAQSIGVSQRADVRAQEFPLRNRARDGHTTGWQIVGRVGNRNRQRGDVVAVILGIGTYHPKRDLSAMHTFRGLIVTRRDHHGLGGVCCAEGQNAFIKIEAVIAVLLQVDLDVPRRRRGQAEAQGLTATATTFDQRQRAIIGGRHSHCIANHTQGLHHHRTSAGIVECAAGIKGLQCQTQITRHGARQQISLGHLCCRQVDRRIHRVGSTD